MSNPPCPICFCDIKTGYEYQTDCNHIFCKNCIHCYADLHNGDLSCPLCRQTFYFDEDRIKIPFDLNNYPKDPEGIQEDIVIAGYKTVSKLQKWQLLYNYKVDNNTGFTFTKNPEINSLMNQINEDYDQNHTGFTMGYTMQQLRYIAYYGLSRYLRVKETSALAVQTHLS